MNKFEHYDGLEIESLNQIPPDILDRAVDYLNKNLVHSDKAHTCYGIKQHLASGAANIYLTQEIFYELLLHAGYKPMKTQFDNSGLPLFKYWWRKTLKD